MHKLFVPQEIIMDGFVNVTGEDFDHLRVLRIRTGEKLEISNGQDRCFDAVVEKTDRNSVTFRILSEHPFRNEPRIDITVCFALLKGGANEDVIKQSVELGATRIVLFSSTNCIAKEREKTEKYEKVARQASMQSGRDRIPTVVSGLTFEEMIKELKSADFPVFFHEKATLPFYDAIIKNKNPRSTAFAVGPEGGFTDDEVRCAEENGIPVVSLGKRILRAVTVPLCALSVISTVYDPLR